MINLIIFGTTPFSQMVAKYIEAEKAAHVVAFCVNREYLQTETLCDKPVVAFEDLKLNYDMNQFQILNTVGYTKMNSLRELISDQCIKSGYKMFNFVSCKSQLYCDVTGYNNIILPNVFIGNNVTFKNNNIFYSGCMLTHDISIGSNNFFGANSTFGGNVTVGNSCFFGLNCTVKNKINIADKTLLGAGAYLSKDTYPGQVVVPAKSITLDKSSENFI